MNVNFIKLFLLFIVLVSLQVFLLSNIHLFGLATPLLYIYFVLKLPVLMSRNLVLLLSFTMGLVIDLLSQTLGLNMLALSIVGFCRAYVFRVFAPKEVFDNFIPSFTTFGMLPFLGYAAVMALIHHTLVFSIEMFSMLDFGSLMARIFSSTALTLVLIFAFECFKFDYKRSTS